MNSETGEMVVCQLYRLVKMDGEFIKDDPKLRKTMRKRVVVTKDYMEMRNKNWKDNGELYIKDDALTEEYYEKSAEQWAERKERKELETTGARNLAKAIMGTGGVSEIKPKVKSEKKKDSPPAKEKEEPKVVVVPDGDPQFEWDHDQLIAWLKRQEDVPEFKPTIGKKVLWETVVEPYMNPEEAPAADGGTDDTSGNDDGNDTTDTTSTSNDNTNKGEFPEGDPVYEWERKELVAWIQSQDDCPDFKPTVGKKVLWEKVIEPYVASKKGGE